MTDARGAGQASGQGDGPQGAPAAPPRDSGLATGSLVFGILSLTCLPLIGVIPAVVLGVLGLRDIDRSRGALGGRGKALAGIILGGLSAIMVVPMMAGFLIPTLMRARSTAEVVLCQSNVRELTKLAILYADDHGGNLPKTLGDLEEAAGRASRG